MGFFSGPKASSTEQNTSFSGLDPNAKKDWSTLFTGAQQGIAPWQQAGFMQAMKQALTTFSGANAAAGGLTASSLPQIASSAAQYVLPQFAEMNTNLLGNLMAQRQISRSQGTRTSTQTGPQIGYNWANDFGSNVTKWAAPSGGETAAKLIG
jgi:hypothetical protein